MSSIYHNPQPFSRSCKCCNAYTLLHYYDRDLLGYSICSDCVTVLESAADALQVAGLKSPSLELGCVINWDEV